MAIDHTGINIVLVKCLSPLIISVKSNVLTFPKDITPYVLE